MNKVYKLTDQQMKTRGPTRWVQMKPLEQFNQSPGAGAGDKL